MPSPLPPPSSGGPGPVPVALLPRRPAADPADAPSTHAAFPAAGPDGHRPDLLALDAGEQFRFGFDMGACIGCHSCEVACGEQNGLPAGTVWRRVGEIEGGAHPETRRWHLSMSCNHCVEPACLEGCPTNAYEKLPNGIVDHHADDCIGCQYCTWNCPYSVPAFQPDRRIVTKCDLCRPRLDDGYEPACVQACPTHAITVEKVRTDEWIADPSAGDAPGLPDVGLTLSTTRIALPEDLPAGAVAASDWNLRPEHPHWPLVWLTLLSQAAVGSSVVATGTGHRVIAALLSMAALAAAPFHLGRLAAAHKALRNLRRSWLSREVALFSLYGALAVPAVAVPALGVPAAVVGVAGIYASARLYLVPGRPAWDSWLTVVRFAATAGALGLALTGRPGPAVLVATAGAAATAANWWRLRRHPDQAGWGSVRLELRWFRPWTVVRLALLVVAGAVVVLVGTTAPAVVAVVVLLAAGEGVGRWLFFVTVVPLNMPGSFWRGTAGSAR